MFLDRSTLHTSLFGLVGFNNADDPEYPTLTPSLITSRSGRTFNQVHSLLTIENIDQCFKNFSQYQYDDWLPGEEYSLGEKRTDGINSFEYINETASTGNALSNGTYWKQINDLSDFLIKSVYRGIDEMIDAYIDSKSLKGKVKSIFQDILLFQGAGNFRDVETNADKFVGLRLRFRKSERHILSIINKIGLQFDQVITGGENLTIKIYHTSKQQPIFTYTITHENAKDFKWTTLATDNVLKFLDDDLDAGGDFFIGYKQSDLAAISTAPKAINKKLTWGQRPCDCDPRWADYFKQYSPFVEIIGFEINESEMPADVLFDPDKVTYTSLKNYGINLNLTTKCDLTPFFIQEEAIMERALSYSVGLVLLEEMANSTRKGNTLANTVRQEAAKQLYHHKGAFGTVYDKFHQSIKALSFDFSGMENSCMPSDHPFEMDIDMGSV